MFRDGNGDPNAPVCDCSPVHFKKVFNLHFGGQPYLKFDSFSIWHQPRKSYTLGDLENPLKIIENN